MLLDKIKNIIELHMIQIIEKDSYMSECVIFFVLCLLMKLFVKNKVLENNYFHTPINMQQFINGIRFIIFTYIWTTINFINHLI